MYGIRALFWNAPTARYSGIVNSVSVECEVNVTLSVIGSPCSMNRLLPIPGFGETSIKRLGSTAEGVSPGLTGEGTGINGLDEGEVV
jgi:hypothetical protein